MTVFVFKSKGIGCKLLRSYGFEIASRIFVTQANESIVSDIMKYLQNHGEKFKVIKHNKSGFLPIIADFD